LTWANLSPDTAVGPGAGPRLRGIDALRQRAIQVWAVTGWTVLALFLLADLWLGSGDSVPLLAVGSLANVVPTAMALRRRYDAAARAATGTLAAVLPAMLVFLLRGQGWQTDAHMYFFVAMSGLAVLGDWRPIAVATVLTAGHHLAFEAMQPDWVFTGVGRLERVLFHVVAVGLEFAVLAVLTVRLRLLLDAQDAAVTRSDELALAADAERDRTLRALEQVRAAEREADRERRARAEAQARVAAERRGEFVTLAGEFERSVTSAVRAMAAGTERLEASAAELRRVTAGADDMADEVSGNAARASAEIARVAASMRDLSRSIRTIATASGDQSRLTDTASIAAERSVQTIAMLEEQAARIEALVEDIRKIAGKTNLLALNATIEAARAGEAGRGFSVVAGEVKGLAAETARASDEISGLLADIREGVRDTGAKLRGVNGAIREVASAAAGIASAADEQRATAHSVDRGADRAAADSADTGERIGAVARAANAAAALSTEVQDGVTQLAAGARTLRASTDLFLSFLHDDQAGDRVAA